MTCGMALKFLVNNEGFVCSCDKVIYAKDMYDAVLDADAMLLVTEWKQFRLPSWGVIHKSMKHPLVIDGRNIYDPEEMKGNGFEYLCIGRI